MSIQSVPVLKADPMSEAEIQEFDHAISLVSDDLDRFCSSFETLDSLTDTVETLIKSLCDYADKSDDPRHGHTVSQILTLLELMGGIAKDAAEGCDALLSFNE